MIRVKDEPATYALVGEEVLWVAAVLEKVGDEVIAALGLEVEHLVVRLLVVEEKENFDVTEE